MTSTSARVLIETLESQRDLLCQRAVDLQYARQPEIWSKYGAKGRELSLRDQGFLFDYLTESLTSSDPELFIDYVRWLKVLFAGLGFPENALSENLRVSADALAEIVDSSVGAPGTAILHDALEAVEAAPAELPTHLGDDLPLRDLARDYLGSLLRGDRRTASRLVLDAADAGTDLRDIYLEVFQRSQWEVGRLWHLNQVSVAQEHFCSAATQLIMSQLAPRLFDVPGRGHRFVGACVGGELHEIGLRIVSDFLELEGWDTYFLGANAPTSAILQALEERQAHILGLSASLPLHLGHVAEVIAAVRGVESLEHVKVVVGGYVFRAAPERARGVGADGFAEDANQAISLVDGLVTAA